MCEGGRKEKGGKGQYVPSRTEPSTPYPAPTRERKERRVKKATGNASICPSIVFARDVCPV